ncbi:MAG: entericidin A/B family lipoprotein [Akkermansiaceae bacterium]
MKKLFRITLALLALSTLALTSCSTMAGLGRDIQSAGNALTNSANQ